MTENNAEYGWSADMDMSLHDKIRQDMKTAMRNKADLVRNTMRLIIGAFPDLTVAITLENGKKTTRVKQPGEITDDDILGIIRTFVKAEKNVLAHKGETTSDYLDLLNAYLPGMAAPEEIRQWIEDNVDLSRFNSPVQAMGTVMKHYGKLADGRTVQEILKQL